MLQEEYQINELAEETGFSPRTIRYYQQEGLLPEPENRGKFAYYNQDHLERLKLIQELKKNYLPLKEIRDLLNSLTFQQVHDLLASQQGEKLKKPFIGKAAQNKPAKQVSESAIEYITRLRQSQSDILEQKHIPINNMLEQQSNLQRSIANMPSESWRRILITPRIEIHIKEPLSPRDQERLEEIIQISRKLFYK